jgi:hypothetical protein
MIRGFVNLAAYQNTALPSSFLSSLDTGLARVRAAHVKTTLRFKYNNGENSPACAEAPKAIMLEHISQLAPVLQKYSDVIVSQEAGFIGCWGEWSGNSPLLNTADETAIVTAMLNALPGRSVQLRTPTYKAAIYNAPSPMTSADAFDGSDRSRTGHYNDCILSTQNGQDFTYPTNAIQQWMGYVTTETQWTPMGGETCGRTTNVPSGQIAASSCIQVGGQAQSRLSAYHFTYLNYGDIVQSDWQAQGCFAEVGANLGYRLSLTSVDYTTYPVVGGSLHLNINLRNTGYAAIFNPRPFYVVLDGNGDRFNLPLNADPRRWASGTSQSLSLDVPLPTTIPPGAYRLSLWLPDAAADLQNDPLYAIQFANSGIWDATTGLNVITKSILVESGTGMQAPVITSSKTANATVGTTFTYQITATNGPTSFAATGLPAGLSVNASTGMISGTPTSAGTPAILLAASNSVGTGDGNLALTVSPPAPLSGAWFNIVSKNSGKCLDVTGGSTSPDVQLQQWACTGAANQKFSFTAVSGGNEITAQNSGLQLDVQGGESFTQDGTPIIQWPYWGGTNEIWNLSAASAGTYTITALSSGKCLSVSGNSQKNGAKIIQWTCNGSTSQDWSLVPPQ